MTKEEYIERGYIEKYGVLWPKSKQDPAVIEQEMVRGENNEHKSPGFLGKKEHFKRFCTILFCHEKAVQPLEWNPNALEILDAYFEDGNKWTCIVGHGGSGKSRIIAAIATGDFLIDPVNTSCLLTSTTLTDGQKRVWADVERFWYSAAEYFGGLDKLPGVLNSSISVIRYQDLETGRPDKARGLALIPSGNDSEDSSVGRMVGFKAPRLRLFIDEASYITWKVVETAESNLETSGVDFRVMVTLNPVVKTDTGGKLCCPVNASGVEDWKAVDTTSEKRWKNKRGVTIRFSGYDSPNVKLAREGVIGPTMHDRKWSLPFTLELFEDQRLRLSTASFQRQYLAIWPEGEVIETIFTDDEVRHHGGHLKCQQKAEIVASIWGLDPSWTHDGDGCPLLNTLLIRDQLDRLILEYKGMERMDEEIDPTKDAVLQIEAKIASRLNALKIKGKDFGMDVTGGGRNVYSHVMEKWHGPGSMDVVFNGAPTDKPVSALDKTPANERYTDLMTEMWMFLKELLMSGQLKNLPDFIIEQICARRYYTNKDGSQSFDKKGRICLEENRKVKKRLGKGTDEANALAIAAHVAKMHYGLMPDAKPASAPPPEPKNPILEMFKFESLSKAPTGSFKAKMRRFGNLLSGPPRIE